jgi:formiminotetrahydrofolate cyclodeaminase
MPESVWNSTLAEFRDRLASVESVPAGVSTAAVSSAFALGLVIKVLAIASGRKDFKGDRSALASLMDEARAHSQILEKCADQDIDAFRQRSRAAIEVPLRAARAAASGMSLCNRAEGMIHAAVAPDAAAAGEILSGAVKAILCSLEFNLRQLKEDDPYRLEVAAQLQQLSATKKAG